MTATVTELPTWATTRALIAANERAVASLLDYTALPAATVTATADAVLVTVATLADLAEWVRCDAGALSAYRPITQADVPGGFRATTVRLRLTSSGRTVNLRVATIHPATADDPDGIQIGIAA